MQALISFLLRFSRTHLYLYLYLKLIRTFSSGSNLCRSQFLLQTREFFTDIFVSRNCDGPISISLYNILSHNFTV